MQIKRYFVAVLLCSASCLAHAEPVNQALLPQDRQIIASIKYQYVGENLRINQEAIESHVQLKKGSEFKQHLADSSIKSLYGTGLFDYIQVRLDKVNDEKYDVTFILTQKLRVNDLTVTGNSKIKDRLIRDKINTLPGGSYSESTLHQDIKSLKKLYEDKGFPYARVENSVKDANDGTAVDVTININEGPKIHVGKISFTGIDGIGEKELKSVMQTKSWNIFSWLQGTGTFKRDILEEDVNRLKATIKNHGYLDVEIAESDVVCTDGKVSIDININVKKGDIYHLGKISLDGNTLYKAEELAELLALKTGEVFSPEKVDNACSRIRDFYGKNGYLETGVGFERFPNISTGKLDLVFHIEESERYFLHAIDLKGNTKTKNNVILRELALAPGDSFDTVRMKNSQARLRNTYFFENVDVSPVDSGVANKKNLRIEVKEAMTGKFSIGGGISTGSQVVGFLELSQANFDLFGKNPRFQGAGQKFRTRFQVGKHSHSFSLNFEEPWWYNRELAVGTNLFASKQEYKKSDYNYNGSSYDEARVGGDVYLRKRIYGLWEGTATYHLENIKISSVGKDAPTSFKADEGNRLISKGVFLLERDTRNNLFYPTSGSTISLTTEVAGGPFLGKTKYVKLDALAAKIFPTFELFDQTLTFMGKSGSISAFGHDHVPFFERFFLGGSNYMKGFKGSDIGPHENGVGEGGQTYAYGTAEYTFKIADPLRVYLFAEAGFVNAKRWDFNRKGYCTDIGFGFKIFIMGAPLRLDFGFPLHGQDSNKHGMRFNYSFGVTF